MTAFENSLPEFPTTENFWGLIAFEGWRLAHLKVGVRPIWTALKDEQEGFMILVVDDHADTRRAITRLLNLEGYECVGVEDGNQALVLLRVVRPQLIILDHGLPGMNGIEIFQEIQKLPGKQDIPVIMFSGYDGPLGTLRERALAVGIKSYLVKGSLDWNILYREIVRLGGPSDVSPVLAQGYKRWKI